MSHPLHTDYREKTRILRTTELYRRRLVRTERQRSELQTWLEKGGMNHSFHRVKKAYEDAFFADDNAAPVRSYPLNTPAGSAGFAFLIDDFMKADAHSLVLDCLMAQIKLMTGFRLLKAERWIPRDEELGCDYHQCYTFREDVGILSKCLNALRGGPKRPFIFLSAVQRNGKAPRIELLWEGPAGHPHRLHALMERWLGSSPEGIDFSRVFKRKHLINRLWK